MKAWMVVVAVAGAGASAHANDFADGSSIYVSTARVRIGDRVYSAGNVALRKPAGTLEFDLALPGLPAVHAVGSVARDGSIVFTTANRYDPPAAIDVNGDTVSSETGTFTLREVALTGAQAPTCDGPCTGSSMFEITGGAIVATGSFGAEVVSIDDIRGIGGVARAPLASIAARPLVCGQPYQTFAVTLAAPAPAGGERVDLSASMGRVPPGILVPPGRTSANVYVATPAAYLGTITVNAAAGGAKRRASLSLNCRAR